MPKFIFNSRKVPFSMTCRYLNVMAGVLVEEANSKYSTIKTMPELYEQLCKRYDEWHQEQAPKRHAGAGKVNITYDPDFNMIRITRPNKCESDYSRITIEE